MSCLPFPASPGQLSRSLKLFAAALLFQILPIGPAVAWDDPTMDEELTLALDLEPDLENGKALFEMCASCHSPDGWGTADGAFPQIAGQHRNVIIKQIADIRYGNRDNPIMAPYAREEAIGGPQGISDVAGYIASLPMTPNPGTGPGTRLEHGAKVYEESCSVCHDDGAEGFDAYFFPKIQGQHYEYLLRQLNWMREGKRRNVYFGMLRRISKMTQADLEAVSDYLSRLPPSDESDE